MSACVLLEGFFWESRVVIERGEGKTYLALSLVRWPLALQVRRLVEDLISGRELLSVGR